MKSSFALSSISLFNHDLQSIGEEKMLITTLNAHCFNLAQADKFYAKALNQSDILLPDGSSVIWAKKFLSGERLRKIAGADLFEYEMHRLNKSNGTCFFLGSSEDVLRKIEDQASLDYPNVTVKWFSPPFSQTFSIEDNARMIKFVNECQPDVLFVGMTAPKQEKWAFENIDLLNTGHICCIGAVFDFYAGKIHRAPRWMINVGFEWFYRLVMEPRRMWRRYLIGNFIFAKLIIKEKMGIIFSS